MDVLRKGNDKYKLCVVETFTKGTNSFKKVAEFAQSRGLQNVFQRDSNFHLKFDNEHNIDVILASGGMWEEARGSY